MQIILASAKIMHDKLKSIPDISLSIPRFQNEADAFAMGYPLCFNDFTHLYDNVPQRDKAETRYCVRSSFSGGNGPYNRVHHGENMISPKKQDEIMKILAKFGRVKKIQSSD